VHWRIYEGVQGNNRSDEAMEQMHRRNCALAKGETGHARFLHHATKACEQMSSVTAEEFDQRRKWVEK
jgi:hypothetical protein